MINRFKGKLNDRGSTLIMVIVTLGFIGILVSIILLVTSNNIFTKLVDKKSKDNFYSAECVLEEIESGIQASMSKHMVKAYYEILQSYDNTKTTLYQDLFKSYTLNGVPSDSSSGYINEIKTPETNIFNTSVLIDYLEDGHKAMVGSTDTSNVLEIIGGETGGKIKYTNPGATYEMTIKDLTIKFTYQDYYTEIITDLVIRVPDADFTYQNGAALSDEFKSFCLISNKIDITAGNSKIDGNVWAGKGLDITSETTTLDLKCGAVFAGADSTGVGGISIYDAYGNAGKTNLLISKSLNVGGNATYPFVVAKRLKIDYKSLNPLNFSTNNNNNMDITAACIIADDLALEGAYSNAVIKGTYTGLGSNSSSGTSSSAIYINGKFSSLNMNLDSLNLAGQVCINNGSINNTSPSIAVDSTDIVTGESVSVRGNQAAYLLPISYLPFSSNPVKIDEYNAYVNVLKAANTSLDTNEKVLTEIKNEIKVNIPAGITSKLETSNSIKTYFYKPFTSGSTELVYFYYNFTSGGAKEFFDENYMSNSANISRFASLIPVAELKISSVVNNVAGNYITYATGTDQTIVKGNGDTSFATSANIRYKNMKSYFSTSTVENTEEDAYSKTAIEELIDWSLITKTYAEKPATGTELINIERDGYTVVVIDNADRSSYVVPDDFTGIVIATGDVEFVAGQFTGMIIAKGNMTINIGIDVNSDASIINAILRNANMYEITDSHYLASGSTVTLEEIFAEYKKSTGSNEKSSFVSLENMISYENWKKN